MRGSLRQIQLTQNKLALIDDEDYEVVSKYKWYAKFNHGNWYAETCIKRKTIQMHKLIISTTVNQMVDHCNGNGLDNRKENLRACTNAQNQMNKSKGYGKSSYKGVSWHTQLKKWRARIKVEGKEILLGVFAEEVEAAKAYDKAAREYFGGFACPNFKEIDCHTPIL